MEMNDEEVKYFKGKEEGLDIEKDPMEFEEAKWCVEFVRKRGVTLMNIDLHGSKKMFYYVITP